MSLHEWVDIEIVKATVRHTGSAVIVLACFWVVGWVLQQLFNDWVKEAIKTADGILLLIVFGLLGWNLIKLMAKGGNGSGISTGVILS
jgi:hypothetical protein